MNDKNLDNILRCLSKCPEEFFPFKTIFDKLNIPYDESEEILKTLEINNHIEIKEHPVYEKLIKIKSDGIDFISRTSYEENQNENGVVVRHHI